LKFVAVMYIRLEKPFFSLNAIYEFGDSEPAVT
jgi:hypothetical protein